MSGGYSHQQGEFYDPSYADWQHGQAQYNMGGTEAFPVSQAGAEFGTFTYDEGYDQGYDQGFSSPGTSDSGGYTGRIMTPAPPTSFDQAVNNFEDEPPLLEELGINFEHIYQKTLAVLNPVKQTETSIINDTDLAGPLVFCLAFGASLLFHGKVQFGYIYGIGGLGCVSMYALLNLMALTSVSIYCIMSVLGYCLLPMTILSFSSLVISLQGLFGVFMTGIVVFWCSVAAAKLFVSALSMDHQLLLVAYPCALLYGVFALLTIF